MGEILELDKPSNQKAKILLAMIEGNGVNYRQLGYNGFLARMSELKKFLLEEGICVKFKNVPFINEYGHAGKYRSHYLEKEDKEKAILLYKKVNSFKGADY